MTVYEELQVKAIFGIGDGGANAFLVTAAGPCQSKNIRELLSNAKPHIGTATRLLSLPQEGDQSLRNVLADGTTMPEVDHSIGVKDKCSTTLILRS